MMPKKANGKPELPDCGIQRQVLLSLMINQPNKTGEDQTMNNAARRSPCGINGRE
jgi:hypothetical protein